MVLSHKWFFGHLMLILLLVGAFEAASQDAEAAAPWVEAGTGVDDEIEEEGQGDAGNF